MGASHIFATSITVNASADVWVREIDPDAAFENDGVCVWAAGAEAGARNGAVEWDISGITETITSAYVELYDANSGHAAAFQQGAALLSPAGIVGMTWNSQSGYTQTALESLGSVSLSGTPATFGTWVASANASAADVAALESLRTGSGKVTMLLTASFGERDWGDAGWLTQPARLVLNAPIPEPSALILLVTGILGLVCYAWRKR
jgi:hypothetical protein